MSKFARTAALVVGIAAVGVATFGFGSAIAAGASFTGALGAASSATLGIAGLTAGTLGAVAGGLGFVASLTARASPKVLGGDPTKFTIDREVGQPVIIGRTAPWGHVWT